MTKLISLPFAGLLIGLLSPLFSMPQANAKDAAYILMYHHVDESTPTSTSVTPEMFAEHMDFIDKARYRVVPLEKLLTVLQKGGRIKPGTLAITFDDAYPSVLSNALPVLKHHKFPFTVFASTAAIDSNSSSYLSWDDLRELEANRGTIANHSHQHQHLLAREADETDEAWRVRIRGDIEFAQQRLEAELKRPAKILAYPYGEFDAQLMALTKEMGYPALGQQSGPVGPGTHLHAVPRFPMATDYAGMPQFAEKLRTRPFTVLAPDVPATVLTPEQDRPTLTLTFESGSYRASRLTCFVTGKGTARTRWQNPESTVAKVTSREPLTAGRTSYTCTAPHESIPDLYYWHTHLYMKPRPDGSWYDH